MNQIVVDVPLTLQLDSLAEPVEIVDQTGRKLGHFVPVPVTPPPDECPYSPEELERMRAQEGGRPLSEIWRSLRAQ